MTLETSLAFKKMQKLETYTALCTAVAGIRRVLIVSFNFALEVLALDQVRDVLVILPFLLPLAFFTLLHGLIALGQFAERGQRVGAQLVEDTRDEFGEFLLFAVAVNGEGVARDGGLDCFCYWLIISSGPIEGVPCILTLGSSEVDNVSVLLEHVHLLDGLDGLHVELLE